MGIAVLKAGARSGTQDRPDTSPPALSGAIRPHLSVVCKAFVAQRRGTGRHGRVGL